MATEKNISKFLAKQVDFSEANKSVEGITSAFMKCESLYDFMELINMHELLIASQLNETPVKEKLFVDFEGSIKSLGAWGGDFALVASNLAYENQKDYFDSKGYHTFFPLSDLL